MYKLILILFLNVISIHYTQEVQPEIVEKKFNIKLLYSNQELEDLNNRILYLFNQAGNDLETINSFGITYILHFNYSGDLFKKDFLNNSFYNNIVLSKNKHHLYKLNDIRYIDVDLILENNEKKYIAYGNALYLSTRSNSNDSFQKIINAKYELNLVHFFTISKLRNWDIFGLSKDNKVYVFSFMKGGLKVQKLEDYVNEHPEIFLE